MRVRKNLNHAAYFLIAGLMLCPNTSAGRLNGFVTLLPPNSLWHYEATGSDLGTLWRETLFDDGLWPAGAGVLGYGEPYINTVIPYGPDSQSKYPTTYFRAQFTVGIDPLEITQLILAANYDDGIVVYLNGIEVARQALPVGTITYTTQASSHEGGNYEVIDLSAHIDKLVPGENVLAVEVHQRSGSSSDLVWDCELKYDLSLVQFLWSGAVTPISARVKAKVLADGASARLMVSTSADMSGAVYSDFDVADAASNNQVVDLAIAGLTPSTQYYYVIEVDGTPDFGNQGRFRTFPVSGPASFQVAFGSCASTGTAHAVFETIAALDPLLFVHVGDFHYENIGINDRDAFRAACETVLASPTQAVLYRSVPIAYVWDDHDYGPNNSDSTAPGREAARLTFKEYVPHYPLAAGSGDVPIYQSFAVGRVKFIFTDCRSARSPWSVPDDAAKTMLGADQKAWFKQELLDAQGTYPLIVWINSLPWIGVTGDDGWYLYTNERRELADFIKANGIGGLCMVSGDAHMLAIDDGSNSDYATGGGAPFPVMHAAALDRGGSVKGGPYSEGAYPGGGQFGLMTVTDTGGTTIGVTWSGRTWENVERVALTFVINTVDGTICICQCHGDPVCDGVIDVLDVVAAADVAFRNGVPLADAACPHGRMDVNCDAVNDILDIVHIVNVAFRNADSATQFCEPCSP